MKRHKLRCDLGAIQYRIAMHMEMHFIARGRSSHTPLNLFLESRKRTSNAIIEFVL